MGRGDCSPSMVASQWRESSSRREPIEAGKPKAVPAATMSWACALMRLGPVVPCVAQLPSVAPSALPKRGWGVRGDNGQEEDPLDAVLRGPEATQAAGWADNEGDAFGWRRAANWTKRLSISP